MLKQPSGCSVFQFSNHDGDLRHRVRTGALQRGFVDKKEDGTYLNGDEPPKELKETVLNDHVLGTMVAYDCAENVLTSADVPILLR